MSGIVSRAWALAILSAATTALASENRLILIDQSDFAAKKGFYLDIEAKSDGSKPIALEDARLIFAVGDGKDWHFLACDPHLKIGDKLVADARIGAGDARLTLNGVKVAGEAVHFLPISRPLTAGTRPDWASDPTPFKLVEDTVSIRLQSVPLEHQPTPDLRLYEFNFRGVRDSAPLSYFERPPASSIEHAPLAAPMALHAEFHVAAAPAGSDYKGLIDRYGQAIAAHWPGKVSSDADLAKSIREETAHEAAWQKPSYVDAYGGTKMAWHENQTGFFRVTKHAGYWWLITPDGNPLFYAGICTSPALKWDVTPTTGREALWKEPLPRDGLYSELWSKGVWGDSQSDEYYAEQSGNLIRKFGPDWKRKATDELVERLDKWGFSGQGKWSDPVPHVSYLPVLNIGAPRVGRHFDVFDPAVLAAIRESLRKQVEPELKNPRILGWSIGNEYDEIITNDEIAAYLKLGDSRPLKKALTSYLATHGYKPNDIEAARQYYAKTYYSFLYKTMKELDPNHLYFGFWIVPNWWQNEQDWSLIAPNCDVIGYDRYSASYVGIENLLAKTDKPTLLGEFSFPAWYGGERAFGRYQNAVETDADSGKKYAELLHDASIDPKCIGTMWFQYRDEPITGRGPGVGPLPVYGEHYAFGLVDGADRPKWDLIERARAANLAATPTRLKLRNGS